MDTPAQVDANKETRVALAARLWLTLSTPNANKKDTKSVMHNVSGSLVKGRT
jgi:hypothetical protein